MRFALIDAKKAEFPVRTMCRVLEVSESGFFSWKGRPASQRQRDDMIYLAHIRTAFELSNRTYGSPRMHRELVDEGLPIGRRRTARLMRENGLAARQKRRFKRTTDSTHTWPIAPNLLDQDFAAEAPDQKWSADISYIWTAEGWLYLAVLMDLFSRRVVGWAVSDRLKKDLALRALRMALVGDAGGPRAGGLNWTRYLAAQEDSKSDTQDQDDEADEGRVPQRPQCGLSCFRVQIVPHDPGVFAVAFDLHVDKDVTLTGDLGLPERQIPEFRRDPYRIGFRRPEFFEYQIAHAPDADSRRLFREFGVVRAQIRMGNDLVFLGKNEDGAAPPIADLANEIRKLV